MSSRSQRRKQRKKQHRPPVTQYGLKSLFKAVFLVASLLGAQRLLGLTPAQAFAWITVVAVFFGIYCLFSWAVTGRRKGTLLVPPDYYDTGVSGGGADSV
jgi:hypothetical protein